MGSRQNMVGRLTSPGFSIVEVLVTTAVVVIGLTAIVQLLSSSLRVSFSNRDVVIGTSLAQEGLELALNFRDNNLANGVLPFDNFAGANNRDFCRLDYLVPQFILSGGSRNCFGSVPVDPSVRYSLELSGGGYTHVNGVRKYARAIAIARDTVNTPPRYQTITSIVWWSGSDARPAGVFPDNIAANVNVANCTVANRCAYVQATLHDWSL